MITDIKKEYIDSLTVSELRFELDKIHARLKEIESLQGMMKELADNGSSFSFNPLLSVLEEDTVLLREEYLVYSSRYNSLREL